MVPMYPGQIPMFPGQEQGPRPFRPVPRDAKPVR
jgi:hypothetical protein